MKKDILFTKKELLALGFKETKEYYGKQETDYPYYSAFYLCGSDVYIDINYDKKGKPNEMSFYFFSDGMLPIDLVNLTKEDLIFFYKSYSFMMAHQDGSKFFNIINTICNNTES